MGADATADACADIAVARLHQRLREEKGVSYAVTPTFDVISPSHRWLTISADCLPEDCTETYETMAVELRRLATDGPTDKDIADAAMRMQRAANAQTTSAMSLARKHLGETTSIADGHEARRVVDVAALPTRLREFLRTPIWLVPYDTDVSDRRLERVSTWTTAVADGPAHESLYNNSTLRVGAHQLSITHGPTQSQLVDTESLACVMEWSDGGLSFYGLDGTVLSVDATDYPGATDQLPGLMAAVDPNIVVRRDQPFRTTEEREAMIAKAEAHGQAKADRGLRRRLSRSAATRSSRGSS